MECEKCKGRGLPYFWCSRWPKGILVEAIPTKEEMLDTLETCRMQGLSKEEYRKAKKAIETLFQKEDKIKQNGDV